MAAELDRIKRNVGKMIDAGAPESEIQTYIKSEGVTVGQLKASRFITDEARASGTKPREADVPKGEVNIAMEGSPSTGEAFLRGVADMGMGGFSDEAGAWVLEKLGRGSYDENLRRQRAYAEGDAANRPVARIAGQLGGALAVPGGSINAATRGARALQGAMAGGAYGGLYGYGSGEGSVANRAANAASGTLVGGAAGGVLGGILPRSGAAAAGSSPRSAETMSAVAAAERQGIPIPDFATRGTTAQNIGRKLQDIPIIGDPIRKAAERTIAATEGRVDDIAAAYGRGGAQSRLTAGASLERSFEAAKDAYATRMGAKYDLVDTLVNPSATAPLTATKRLVDTLTASNKASGLPPGKVVDMLREAAGRKGMTYEAAKNLRTKFGEMLSDRNVLANLKVSEKEARAAYGALTDDLLNVVKQAGGTAAEDAFKSANATAARLLARKDKLAQWIGKSEGESIVAKFIAAARSGGRENLQMLALGRKVIGADKQGGKAAWDKLASATINELGASTRGGAHWSPDVFLSNYAKLTPNGRKILFGSTGRGDLAKALDDLAEASGFIRQMEQFANKSQSGNVAASAAGAAGMITAPWMTISSVIGGRLAAEIMARPATVKALVAWQRAYNAAIARPSQATIRAVNNNAARAGTVIANALGLPRTVLQSVGNKAAADDQPERKASPRVFY